MKLDDSMRKQLPGETDTWLDRLSGEVGQEFEEAYQDFIKTLPSPS